MPTRPKKEFTAIAHTVTGIGWANKEQACCYANISSSTLKKWMQNGLKHSRIGACLRIRYKDLDDFMLSFQAGQDIDLEECSKMAKDIVEDLL